MCLIYVKQPCAVILQRSIVHHLIITKSRYLFTLRVLKDIDILIDCNQLFCILCICNHMYEDTRTP